MQYLLLSNPNVGVITEKQEAFHHAIYFNHDDPIMEEYENARGSMRTRVRYDARFWLIVNLPTAHRVHPDQRIVAFRSAENAMWFKLVFG